MFFCLSFTLILLGFYFYFIFFLTNKFIGKHLSTSFETNSEANNSTKLPGVTKDRTISETEFVSDTFQTNDKDLEEVKAGMKKLGIDTLAQQAGKDGKN